MKRTTVFLPDELHEALRREAFATRQSMAELIRARLAQPALPPKRRVRKKKDALARVEGIVQSGTLTRDIDRELYGI